MKEPPPGRVTCFGETMIRLSSETGVSLEAAEGLRMYAAGCESNVAVALARLGIEARWLSALPDNALGRFVAGQLRRAGVDVSAVRWAPRGRVGLYFTDLGSGEWIRDVVYDREHSAFATCDPHDLEWSALDGSRLLHVSGITPALVPNGAALFERALTEAARRGVAVTLDVNYRRSLWRKEAAQHLLRSHLDDVEFLFVSHRDLEIVADEPDPEDAARSLAASFEVRAVVVTLGREGALACHDGGIVRAPAFEVPIVDRIGRGDAFVGGWLRGWLGGCGPEMALRLGCALAAMAQTYRGDLLWGDEALLERVLRGGSVAGER
jgi:2-dehydro-3-deoxygluconokinase